MSAPRTSGEWFSGRMPVSVIPTVPSRLPQPPSSLFDADSLDDISLEEDQELLVIDVNGPTRKSMIVILEPVDEDDSWDVRLRGQEPTPTSGGLKPDPSFVFIPGKQPGKPCRRWRIRKIVGVFFEKAQPNPAKETKKRNSIHGLLSRGRKAISDLKANIRAHKTAKAMPAKATLLPDNRRLGDEAVHRRAQKACNMPRPTPLNLQKPLPPVPPVERLSELRVPLKTRSEPPRPRKPMIISKPIEIRSRKGSICDFATSPASAGLDTPRRGPSTPTTPRFRWSPLGDGNEIDPEVSWMALE